MTEAEAREEIEILTAWESEPALSVDQVDTLVRKARRADVAGRAPTDEDWEPTWNLAYAIALGWQLKAGIAAGYFDRATFTRQMKESGIHKQCLAMAKEWKKKAATSVPVYPRRAGAYVDYANNTDLVP